MLRLKPILLYTKSINQGSLQLDELKFKNPLLGKKNARQIMSTGNLKALNYLSNETTNCEVQRKCMETSWAQTQ